MQQQKRANSVTHVKCAAALLLCLFLIAAIGCQQPTKALIRETKTEKTPPKPAKPEKPSNGNNGNPNDPQNGGNPGNGQNNEQGKITYQGLDIPDTLARSPQRLREMIIQGRQLSETEPQFNNQGMVVKYVEKEVEYDNGYGHGQGFQRTGSFKSDGLYKSHLHGFYGVAWR